jgi:hypothetical protein
MKRAESIAQMVERLPSKCKALDSNLRNRKKKRI